MRSGNATGTLVFTILSSLAGIACSSDGSSAGPSALPPHVAWAELAVDTIDPNENEYASTPSFIEWAGDNGAAHTKNRSVCATFLTMLLARSYDLTGPDFSAWMGSTSPDAGLYHDAILAENGFQVIAIAPEIEIGDILAIKYPAGNASTGHVMVVTSPPVQRAPTAPLVPGTSQYEVSIIDSSSSPHGPADTRELGGGAFDTGVGEGTFRLYVDSLGAIVGHTWSTEAASTYYNQNERSLTVGRLVDMAASP
jgi:hypothetical protein